jgi:steroid delta-isomerase-like uncharacterized protein
MTFVQLIECKTSHVDDMNRLMDTWVEQTQGKRTATHAMVGQDRADQNHLVEIVEFGSYEEAMRNSSLPETDRIFQEMVALCDEPPTFTDLDLVRDEQLNKATCRRVFTDIAAGNLAFIDEICTADIIHHDPANQADILGRDGLRAEARRYLDAFTFTFTINAQLADGDECTTRWTWNATNTGEFLGMPATGKTIECDGTTTFRLRDGQICEGWWHWDALGMLRQLDVVKM